jgi:hypothetical protein
MAGPKWDVSVGEGTGRHVELRVLVSVGSDQCKVIVEPVRGGAAHVQVAAHDEAGRVAGEVVRHLVEQAVSGFLKSESLD